MRTASHTPSPPWSVPAGLRFTSRMRRLPLRIFPFDGALGEVLVHPRSAADAIFGGLVAYEVGKCPGFPGPATRSMPAGPSMMTRLREGRAYAANLGG